MNELPDNVVPFEPGVSFETAAPAPLATDSAVLAQPAALPSTSAPIASPEEPAAAAPVPPAAIGVSAEKMPSEPSPASAETPPDPADAFTTKRQGPEDKDAPPEEYLYDEETRSFLRKNTAGTWVSLGEGAFLRHLKKDFGIRDKPLPGKIISQAHEILSDIENNRRVAFTGVIAGHKSGLHLVAGRRVLVTEDPVYITLQKGEWPTLEKFFEGLLVGQEPSDDKGNKVTIDQRPHFFAWLQHVMQCYYEGRTSTGLALCLAGGPDCGKSFLALLLRWMLGGRVARPYDAMIGKDNFNRDLVEAVMQLVDDDNQQDTRLEARLKFAGEIKKIVANNEFRLRAMHRDGFAIEVLRRLVVLVNLQLSRLMVLPPLDGDVNDKLLILKGYARPMPPTGRPTIDTPAEQACWPAPMPTRTEEEKATYRATVRGELPAFLFWLLREFKMPSQVSGGRFVVRHWHHPAIASALRELSPHLRVWDLILQSKVVLHEFRSEDGTTAGQYFWRTEWNGTASELHALLTGEQSKLTIDQQRELPKPNWLGQRLSEFEEDFGSEVCHLSATRTRKNWRLRPRAEDREGKA